MQVSISARHGELSAGTQEKMREKVSRLPKFFDRLTAIQVTVDLEHADAPAVEIRASAERAEAFVSKETAPNALAALDGALHKLEQQLRKENEKRREVRRTAGPAKHAAAAGEGAGDEAEAE